MENYMKIILAPIQGVTFAHYRNLHAQIFGGVDTYYAPFIATTNVKNIGMKVFKDILPEYNDQSIHVLPQLIGKEGNDFRKYANIITELGYKEIDWNIGCPYHTVTKKKKGSGILPYPRMIRTFLEEVCKDTHYDLTVKMRLGYEDYDEGIEVIKILNEYPIKGVTIHGRTAEQLYNGHVDLDAFDRLYEICEHEVTYNGDIFTKEDFDRIQNRYPKINHFMLARGALRDPFLPAAIKGVSVPDNKKLEIIKDFHDGVYNHYRDILSGDKHLTDKMKEFWYYTSTHLDHDGKFMKKIRKVKSREAYLDIVHQMLDSSNKWT